MKRKNLLAVVGAWLALVLAPPELHSANSGVATATGTVEGRIQNAVSGDFLNNARIVVAGTNRVVSTDQTGRYRLSGIPAGHATLRVSYTGLEPQEAAVEILPGGTVRQDFSLRHSEIVKLDKFTVVETREMDGMSIAINEQRHAGNMKTVVAADAFGDVSEGNVGEFLKLLPGVTINTGDFTDEAQDITLRGFAPEFTPVMIDGNDVANAAAAADSLSRGGGNLSGLSMSNVSRVEVIKSPLPSIGADFLGGAVNLISKSAFERTKPQLKVRGTVQFSSLAKSVDKTAGPGNTLTRKARPGYDISYVHPVNERFGFTFSSLFSDQYRKVINNNHTWEYAANQGGSETAPYRRQLQVREDDRAPKSFSAALGADWRPFPSLTLQTRVRHHLYVIPSSGNRITFNTGNNPVAYAPDFTQGRPGAGSVGFADNSSEAEQKTDDFALSGRYERQRWTLDFSGTLSTSSRDASATDNGYFITSTTTIPSPTVEFSGIGVDGNFNRFPRGVVVRNTGGAVVDWKRLDSFRTTAVSAIDRELSDKFTSARANLRREFDLGRNPAAVQIGGAYRERIMDKREINRGWTYLGPDGIANNADNTAAPFLAEHVTVGPKFGVPTDIQFPDMRKLYARYRSNPEQFLFNESNAFTNAIGRSERVIEEISAAYLQGELKLFENRLALIGGARFERTANTGYGVLRDRAAAYRRDAGGEFLRDANGNPILITTNALERARLEYTERGSRNHRAYDGWYPSVNMVYEARSDLLLRLGYGRTLGRPNFNFILPTHDIIDDLAESDDPLGQIVTRNPSLKPWEADNIDLSLEYYFKSGGVASIGVFHKRVVNGFGTDTRELDEAGLTAFDLDDRYLGWDVVSTFNIGPAVRIEGIELNYQQRLSFLPISWARGLSVFGNTTLLDHDGPTAQFNVNKRTANWGFRYSYRRVGLGLSWNYTCSSIEPRTAVGPEGVRYNFPKTTLDATSEFRLTPRMGLFFNVRNLTDAPNRKRKDFSPNTPEYSHGATQILLGMKFAAGIQATF